MAQEATQELGMIGFNDPNLHYVTGGYGVRTHDNAGRYPHLPYGGGYVDHDVTALVGVAVGPGVALAPVVPVP